MHASRHITNLLETHCFENSEQKIYSPEDTDVLNMKSLSENFSLVYDPVLAAHVEALFHGCP